MSDTRHVRWAMFNVAGTLTGVFDGSEADAWMIGLGWPSDAEIEEAKRRGVRVAQVEIKEIVR